jgi:hypothetical protein
VGVGVTGGFLDVAERDTGIECCGDERVAERVWSDSLVDPGSTRDASHDPGRAMAIETTTGAVAEDRTVASLPDSEIDRPGGAWGSGIVTVLPPLRWITKVR